MTEPKLLDASQKRQCCIHVGVNKTGTTTMQRHLFPGHKDVAYLGKIAQWGRRKYTNPEVDRLLNRLAGDRLTHGECDTMRAIYREQVAPLLASNRVPVWSQEGLCMAPAAKRLNRAKNILDVFGPCSVMIVIRRPEALTEALYFQRLQGAALGRRRKQRFNSHFSIEHWLEDRWQATGRFRIGPLDYARTARQYACLFGMANVGVFCFEQLVESSDSFVTEISQFMGIEPVQAQQLMAGKRENVRWTDRQVKQFRQIENSPILSRFYRLMPRPIRRRLIELVKKDRQGEKARAFYSDLWQQRINDSTREGNAYLQENWELPLEQYGYPV